ncbi:MAG: RuBisCO large subunit C-terminal-like domain-containing protein [Casimicrobiaceae bacterium]
MTASTHVLRQRETDASWFHATYRVQAPASAIAARAQAIALEQSIELPLEAVTDVRVLREVVARVDDIAAVGPDAFDVTLQLAVETVGGEAGQLLNMLFGNVSLQQDVALIDVDFPPAMAAHFGGPRFGIGGLRELTGVHGRALTCTALKPQGLAAAQLAQLAGVLARAGIDVIKDDHGLADQMAAPFPERVRAVQHAIGQANRDTGGRCIYAPSLGGHYARMREQVAVARECGVAMLMLAPMVCGVAALSALASEARMPILAHPALAGVTRMHPPVLLGKLFRLLGADATIFPNHGGRFGYAAAQCIDVATAARQPWCDLAPVLPVAAGGMTVERVPEMCSRFGVDVMLLIGGSLLLAREALGARSRAFVDAVAANCR